MTELSTLYIDSCYYVYLQLFPDVSLILCFLSTTVVFKTNLSI